MLLGLNKMVVKIGFGIWDENKVFMINVIGLMVLVGSIVDLEFGGLGVRGMCDWW